MAQPKRARVGEALDTPTHVQSVASGFGSGRKPARRTGPQTDSSASPQSTRRRAADSEPTAKITFKMPQRHLDNFEELYEKLRAEERAEKRRLTKVAFAGLVFEHGLNEDELRKAIRSAA